ncbi:MAG: hypothetical protein HY266_06825 [Deltaproteobacteria bacterium]|nr:hypothetical protein [Deltaproteobacteria bacterium]
MTRDKAVCIVVSGIASGSVELSQFVEAMKTLTADEKEKVSLYMERQSHVSHQKTGGNQCFTSSS